MALYKLVFLNFNLTLKTSIAYSHMSSIAEIQVCLWWSRNINTADFVASGGGEWLGSWSTQPQPWRVH